MCNRCFFSTSITITFLFNFLQNKQASKQKTVWRWNALRFYSKTLPSGTVLYSYSHFVLQPCPEPLSFQHTEENDVLKCAGAGAPVPGVRMAWAPPTPRSQRQSDRLLACTASPTGLIPTTREAIKTTAKKEKKKKKKKKKIGNNPRPKVFPKKKAPPTPPPR